MPTPTVPHMVLPLAGKYRPAPITTLDGFTFTPEQEAAMDEWAEMWFRLSHDPTPGDEDVFKDAVRALYRFADLGGANHPIEFIRVPDPVVGSFLNAATDAGGKIKIAEALKHIECPNDPLAREMTELREYVDKEYRPEWASKYLGGQYWTAWSAYESFFRFVCGLKYPDDHEERCEAYGAAQLNAGLWWPYFSPDGSFVIYSPRHTRISLDAQFRLHNTTGPAIGWESGTQLYFWEDRAVPRHVIEDPGSITPQEIQREQNAEIRRVMLIQYGLDRWVQDGGAEVVDEDPHHGRLLRIPGTRQDDPAFLVLCVKNATPEPDGSIKDYVLRVHPELRLRNARGDLGEPQRLTAHAARAWTFNMTPFEFDIARNRET